MVLGEGMIRAWKQTGPTVKVSHDNQRRHKGNHLRLGKSYTNTQRISEKREKGGKKKKKVYTPCDGAP